MQNVNRSRAARWCGLGILVVVGLAGCGRSGPTTDGAAGDAALTIQPGPGGRLALLVPDGFDRQDPRAQAWMDAAAEEGLQVAWLGDSELLALGPSANAAFRGILLPDQVHAEASDALIAALTAYADAGGWLMLVYDFGARLPGGGFPFAGPSRMSALAGVEYLFYAARYPVGDVTGNGPISGQPATLRELQVPPGKSGVAPGTVCRNDPRVSANLAATSPTAMLSTDATTATSAPLLTATVADPGALGRAHHAKQFRAPLESPSISRTAPADAPTDADVAVQADAYATATADEAISGYAYGALSYPSYLTAPAGGYGAANGFDAVLLRSTFGCTDPAGTPDAIGVAAARRLQGAGGVLFVNLPLGYLNGETDGMLLRGFLRYFGASLLGQPRLSDHPDAVGGLVFNWHVDAAEALAPLSTLKTAKVWDKGPFSIHLTTGPDTCAEGDGLGLNLAGNAAAQDWVRYFLQKGHQVGSHGGWDHDIYGEGANETNQDAIAVGAYTFLDLLVLNKRDLEAVTGATRPVVEYSAPEGNNPHWAMSWLEGTGHLGYYFLGHTGTGPTRAYRPPVSDTSGLPGELLNPGMWAFPLEPMGCYATFEEFTDYAVSATAVTAWYRALVDFVTANRTSRLVYAHPPGAAAWLSTLTSFLSYAGSKGPLFHWYTMSDLARFDARRLQVEWVEGGTATARVFEATHPTDLRGMAWLLPRSAYDKPRIAAGSGSVASDTASWIVRAKGGTTLRFTATRTR